jgi:hypothetical protein
MTENVLVFFSRADTTYECLIGINPSYVAAVTLWGEGVSKISLAEGTEWHVKGDPLDVAKALGMLHERRLLDKLRSNDAR